MLPIAIQLVNNQVFLGLSFILVAVVVLFYTSNYYRFIGFQTRRSRFWIVLILLSFSVIYLANLDGYQINDDEGGYLYASWRISQGEVPYRDFMTPQMPLFLYTGAFLFKYFLPSLYIVRLLTILVVLIAAYFLFLLGRELFNDDCGLFAVIIFLTNYLVFNHSRSYRSDPIMMGLTIIALFFLIKGEKRNKGLYYLSAGVFYGLATSYKLFGLFPLFGVGLFWIFQLITKRISFKKLVLKSLPLAFGLAIIPLLSVGGMYLAVPDLYEFLVGHHVKQGSDWSTWQVTAKSLTLIVKFIIHNQILTALTILGLYVVIKDNREKSNEAVLLVFLLSSLLIFFILPRPSYNRHMLYLLPIYALLTGRGMLHLFTWQRERWRSLAFALFIVYFISSLGVNWQRGSKTEDATQRMAALIAEYVAPDEYIVADYASLAFHSRRRMPPLLGGASHGSIASGQTKVEDYIENIEKYKVKLVLIQNDGHGTIQVLANFSKLRQLLKKKYRRIFHDYRREKDTFDIYLRAN